MTLTQFVDQVLATHKAVGSGQCGELVDLYLVECFNNHTSYNTALEYWQNGIPGFVKVGSPQPGDIACYNAHPGFPAGHIAIYTGNGEVFEQNADPDGSLPHIYPRANTYLLGYLRSEEATVDTTKPLTQEEIQSIYTGYTLGEAAPADHIAAWLGKPLDTYLQYLASDPSIQSLQKGYKDGGGTPTVVVNGTTYVPQ